MQEVKLGDIATISAGNGAPQSKELFKNGTFPFFRTSDVGAIHHSKSLTVVRDYLNDAGIKGLKKYPKGTILFPKSGASTYLNHRVKMGIDGYVVSHLAAIVPIKSLVDEDYLYYCLTTIDAKSLNQDQDYPSLKNSVLASIKVPLPPLQQQAAIAKRLDFAFERIDQSISLTKHNIENIQLLYDSVFRSYMSNLDGEETSLLDMTEINTKLIDPRKDPYQDFLHVGAGNIEIGNGKLDNLKTAKQEKLISSKFPFDENTVLYSKIRPYLMKVARPNFVGVCSADVYPLNVRDGLDKDYLFYLLLSPDFTQYAIAGSQRAGMPKVNREHLFAYRFTLPDIARQQEVVAKLDILLEVKSKLHEKYMKKLGYLSSLKISMLKESFSESAVK